MDYPWAYSLLAVLVVSLLSFTGVLFLALKKGTLEKFLLFLVSLAAGGLLGGAFIHLLPEAVEQLGIGISFSASILTGILSFFVLEKFIHWRHCHIPTSKHHPHPLALMNLFGDAFHNLIDGAIIAGSFLISVPLGMATTIAVIIHEIPQEIGDFGVLVYGGFSKTKALLFNFCSALTAFLGVVLVLLFGTKFTNLVPLILPFTAGGFIYIAGADLIPELKKETGLSKSIFQFFGLLLGIGLMLLLTLFE